MLESMRKRRAIPRFRGGILFAAAIFAATLTLASIPAAAEALFPVRVICDGKKTVHMIADGTVADVLAAAGIALEEQDFADVPLDEAVEENDTVTVTRRRTVVREETTELPFKTVTIETSLLASGQEKLLVQGKTGLRTETYAAKVVDGVRGEASLVSDETTVKPVNAKVLVGFPSEPVSKLDFQWEFDENGEPEAYAQVFRDQRAAGYSARTGAKTAAGYKDAVGYVAVNPQEIPYGSKLFIRSEDGEFVYGYAIAADTGTALRQGAIDVDLFYGTYVESALNGIRNVDIYVLE